jgi:hypothetical protein
MVEFEADVLGAGIMTVPLHRIQRRNRGRTPLEGRFPTHRFCGGGFFEQELNLERARLYPRGYEGVLNPEVD